ncbi:toll/interleukin-1 receptor domain-containing protein [Streptomyces violascens]|uniref:toll/interleukin-1 receptor domain-containing protein n=1 Tax=Streptomyces violascens TaxID=67381 RepID=UPI0037A8CB91
MKGKTTQSPHQYDQLMDRRWSGKLRLDLVDALTELPGADTDAFFSAHGLGEAYHRPGRMSGKKARINSAIRAAETEERADLVLSQAADHFKLALNEDSTQRYAESTVSPEPRTGMTSGKSIFVSHASADRELATTIKDHLVLGGVPSGRIFFSSENSTGIPAGQNVHRHLQETLAKSALVIEVISATFLTRPYCLMELGAAWVLDKPTYPLVVPPLTIPEATLAVGNVKMGKLGSESDTDSVFDELHEMLVAIPGIDLPMRPWREAVQKFKRATREMPWGNE